MKTATILSLAVMSLAALPVAANINLLVDGDFENPITFDGPPFVGVWEGFAGGGAAAANSAVLPFTGAQSLALSISGTPNTFAGAFQDVPGLVSGDSYNISGWHATTSSQLDLGVEVRVEWRNSGSNTEISRTPNFTPVPSADYSPFGFTAQVPAGADIARVVYAVQSFSTAPLGNGTVYVDDLAFTVVPEPTVVTLVGLGALALAARRRFQA
jgi:hypothetical protein